MKKRWIKGIVRITLALLLSVVTASLVYADDVVSNGDFSLGSGYWTPVPIPGTTLSTVDPNCDHSASNPALSITPSAGSGDAYQCIYLTSGGSDWTLSADMRLHNASSAQVMAQFYSGDQCDGTAGPSEYISTLSATSWTNLSTTFTYSAPAASSVRVSLSSAFGTACFDNVSLAAAGATDVSSHGLQATGPAWPLWALPVVGLGIATIAVARLWRRRSARLLGHCAVVSGQEPVE